MNKTENITLINGVFTPDEAKEVLLTLISNKIHFHQMKNFSSEERFGKSDPLSSKRITELEESRKQVIALLAKAGNSGHKLIVESILQISEGEKIQETNYKETSSYDSKYEKPELIELW